MSERDAIFINPILMTAIFVENKKVKLSEL